MSKHKAFREEIEAAIVVLQRRQAEMAEVIQTCIQQSTQQRGIPPEHGFTAGLRCNAIGFAVSMHQQGDHPLGLSDERILETARRFYRFMTDGS